MDANELIEYWSKIKSTNIHPDDRGLIDPNAFCLDQIPVPWAGPLKNAKVFTLLLNPVYTDNDKQYELANSALRKALRANFSGLVPCFSFQKTFGDYHGHHWARDTYGNDIVDSHANSICQVNLVAYHSATGDVAKKLSSRLPTSLFVQRFVRESLVPRARAGEIGLVVARSSRNWGIGIAEASHNIVVYAGWENRRARQTKNTRGGQLIRRFLHPCSKAADTPIAEFERCENTPSKATGVCGIDSSETSSDGIAENNQDRPINIRPSAPQRVSNFDMKSTDLLTWQVGTRVEDSNVRPSSKRYAWLKTLQSTESFSAAKRIPVMCCGTTIENVGAGHVKWAVDHGFLVVVAHSQ